MPPFQRDDPYSVYNFEVEINGISDDGSTARASFSEISGLEIEQEAIDYRNGSEDIRARKLPGLKKFTNITMKRGITGHLDFWNWIRTAMKGQVQRADGSIILLDENRQEVQRWTFTRAWPCKYTGPGLNAANSEVAIETLEVCHESLDIDGQS